MGSSPLLLDFLKELQTIISDLDKRTLDSRITKTIQPPKRKNGKPTTVIDVKELELSEISQEVKLHNLDLVIQFLINGLAKVNHLSVSYAEVLSITKSLPYLNTYYFESCLEDEKNNLKDIGLQLITLQGVINSYKDCGYGSPEKYNQPFYFIVEKSLNILSSLL